MTYQASIDLYGIDFRVCSNATVRDIS